MKTTSMCLNSPEEESKILKEIETEIATLLTSCPRAGKGVHNWLFRTALKLQRQYGIETYQVKQMLYEATENCGRAVIDSEIENAVRNSKAAIENKTTQRTTPRWPATNPKEIASIIKNGATLTTLQGLSRVKFTDGKPHTEEILDILFPGDALLCVGRSNKDCLTARRRELKGNLSEQQFIVPSPMSAQRGRTKDGRWSMRTLDNTGPRRFQIVEFDEGGMDQQAALLLRLAKFAPLVLVVHSGGKSLHGWFFSGRAGMARQKKFMRYAVSLGADPATWVRCQLVRMPDGTRDNGKRQAVQFYNPAELEVK